MERKKKKEIYCTVRKRRRKEQERKDHPDYGGICVFVRRLLGVTEFKARIVYRDLIVTCVRRRHDEYANKRDISLRESPTVQYTVQSGYRASRAVIINYGKQFDATKCTVVGNELNPAG